MLKRIWNMKILGKILGTAALFFAFAATASAATLTLTPSSKALNVGDTLTVDIMLDAQGQKIDGVDLQALNYNPYFLQLQDADSATQGVQISAGSLMPNTLANSADTVNGKIVFSQITNAGSTYTGSGKLATATFKALVAGTAKLTLNFTPGATTDTNVASSGGDVLTSVTNGQYDIGNPVPAGSAAGNPSAGSGNAGTSNSPGSTVSLSLVNASGTFYLIMDGVRHGITNPGLLFSYGFSFSQAKTATAQDIALPEGDLLLPGNGVLAKSSADPTVFLISEGQRHGFTSAQVFTALGFKFSQVLVMTTPELNKQPVGTVINDGTTAHLPGVNVKDSKGTIYWINPAGVRNAYPSLEVYNSWNVPGDFSRVLTANAADLNLPVAEMVTKRILN
jgi:hypothetical protein